MNLKIKVSKMVASQMREGHTSCWHLRQQHCSPAIEVSKSSQVAWSSTYRVLEPDLVETIKGNTFDVGYRRQSRLGGLSGLDGRQRGCDGRFWWLGACSSGHASSNKERNS